MKMIKAKIPKLKILYYQAAKKPSELTVFAHTLMSAKEIPLVKFGLTLLETFPVANDNLVFECFSFSIYSFKEIYTFNEDLQDDRPEEIARKYGLLPPIIRKLDTALQSNRYNRERVVEGLTLLRTELKSSSLDTKTIRKAKSTLHKLIS